MMEDLLNYYRDCFSLVNLFHFNSEMTRGEYEKCLGKLEGRTVPILHNGIKDNRRIRSYSKKGLVAGFIGNDTPYKGLHVLIDAVAGLDVDVMVWGGRKMERGRIHYRGKFSQSQLADVYAEMDVLVVPSIWKETFSLVTLEALSYGVPVIVSDNVGAQDIVKQYDERFVYHGKTELMDLIKTILVDKSLLQEYNRQICELPWNHDMLLHANEIINRIYQG